MPNELQDHLKRKLQEQRNEERQNKQLKREGYQQQQTEEADKEWQKLNEAADRVIEQGYQGYDNWISAYSQIIGICNKLAKAISASDPTGTLAAKVFDNTFRPLIHKAEDYFGNQMPDFKVQGVDYTSDNKLDINGLNVTAADGTLLPEGTNEIFQLGVRSWLNKNGFTATNRGSSEPSEFKDRDGNTLTQDRFYDLLEDKDQGLGAYLGKHYDVEVDYQPTPRP